MDSLESGLLELGIAADFEAAPSKPVEPKITGMKVDTENVRILYIFARNASTRSMLTEILQKVVFGGR